MGNADNVADLLVPSTEITYFRKCSVRPCHNNRLIRLPFADSRDRRDLCYNHALSVLEGDLREANGQYIRALNSGNNKWDVITYTHNLPTIQENTQIIRELIAALKSDDFFNVLRSLVLSEDNRVLIETIISVLDNNGQINIPRFQDSLSKIIDSPDQHAEFRVEMALKASTDKELLKGMVEKCSNAIYSRGSTHNPLRNYRYNAEQRLEELSKKK